MSPSLALLEGTTVKPFTSPVINNLILFVIVKLVLVSVGTEGHALIAGDFIIDKLYYLCMRILYVPMTGLLAPRSACDSKCIFEMPRISRSLRTMRSNLASKAIQVAVVKLSRLCNYSNG